MVIIQKAKTLKVQAYESIRDAIISKQIQQDQIYSEQWFADSFQISRTPVREALLQLRTEGLIEVLPNRGVIVKPMTLSDAYYLYQMRIAIEGFCSSYLAVHRDEERARQAITHVEVLLESCHRNFNREIEMEFHTEIIRFTGNQEFLAQYDRMRTRMDVYWSELVRAESRKEEIYHEHKKILDAIQAGDAFGAVQASTDHIMTIFYKLRESQLFSDHK